MKKIFYLLPFLSLLWACEKNATVQPENIAPKLVTYCYLADDDSLISVKVRQSSPVFGTPVDINEPFSNANVSLISSQQSITVPYNSNLGFYQTTRGNSTFSPGQEIKLSVVAPDGRVSTGTGKFPIYKAVPTLSTPYWTMDSVYTSVYDSLTNTYVDKYVLDSTINIQIKWTDSPHETNYYKIELIAEIPGPNNELFLTNLSGYTPYITELTDKNRSGGEFSYTLKIQKFNLKVQNYMADLLTLGLYTCSEEYYWMEKEKYENQGENGPFSEPNFVYSNMKDGIGVFATYRVSKAKIIIP